MARRQVAANAGCLIRLQRDLEDIPTLGSVKLTFPDGAGNLQHFHVRIVPEAGIWRGAKFDFNFVIPDDWPIERPKVTIITRIWHPNIAEPPECGVCLNILRKNYAPTIQITQLIAGLQYLFSEPNPQDPLNTEAAQQFLQNQPAFRLKAEEYIRNYCPQN
jgi:ubiquitin-conjugating enzyme E2 M